MPCEARCTLSTSPTARYKQITDEPPALMKGRVMPMTGSSDSHMPMLTMTWLMIMNITP